MLQGPGGSATFGIAPDPTKERSLIWQAYNNKRIDAPILSLSYNTMRMIIGAADGINCKDWISIKPVTNDSWLLKADQVMFMGDTKLGEEMTTVGLD
jgi:hypothetical protein